MESNNVTQMPVAGLDGITRADLEREIRGLIHVARMKVAQLSSTSDPATVRLARRRLAELYLTARRERVRPFSRGQEAERHG